MKRAAPAPGRRQVGKAILLVENLGVTHERDGTLAVVHVSGRIDSATSARFEAQLQDVLADPPAALILDLGDLAYMSSAGLRVLLVIAKRARAEARPLILCNLAPPIREVFDISGFSTIFDIAATRSEAEARARG